MTDENMRVNFNPSDIKEKEEVSANDPWEDDMLRRKRFANSLTDLVSIAGNSPLGIAIEGEWGSGKTFLLQRWCVEFSKQGKVIYFDAWADDFHADPLTAIIGQLWNEMRVSKWKEVYDLWEEEYIAFTMEKIFVDAERKFAWKQKHVSIVIRKVFENVWCKKCIAIVMRRYIKFFGLTKNNLQTGAGKTMDEYLQIKENVNEIRERLAILVRKTRKKTGLPLVVVVDELDRCRPTFAIQLLERIKHVVNVPGVVFVFGINQKALEESINVIYGNIGAEDYLRRFFQHIMSLPKGEASKYYLHLIHKHEISKNIEKSTVHKAMYHGGFSSDWSHVITKGIPAMVDYMWLSLRQIEQAVRIWLVTLRSIENADAVRSYQLEGALAVFVLLRIKDRDMYEKFFNGNCAVKDIMDCLLHFLPLQEVLSGDEYSKRKYCMSAIVMACYIFYTEEEQREVIDEFQQVGEVVQTGKLMQKYRYVPQKIVEIQHNDTRQESILKLFDLVKQAEQSFRYSNPPSREEIARFLEWGDN